MSDDKFALYAKAIAIAEQIGEEYLTVDTDGLRALLSAYEQAEKEKSEAQARVFELTAQVSFVAGTDIPETMKLARASIVQRNLKLEAQLAAVRKLEFDNHHNALLCAYCNPDNLVLISPAQLAALTASKEPQTARMPEDEWRRTFQHTPHAFRGQVGADCCLDCGEFRQHVYHSPEITRTAPHE